MKEIQTGIAELKTERKQEMESWKTDAIARDWQRLGPLRADLFLAFAERAMTLLSKTDPSLAPEAIKDDRDRIPMLAGFVAGILEEVYEGWGMRGYQEMMRRQFTAVSPSAEPSTHTFARNKGLLTDIQYASVKPSRYFPYDRYDFAELMMRPRWAETEERMALKPLFMFVYGMSFEEMDAKKPPSGLFGRRIVVKERRPWVLEDVKKSWREPVKRGRRSGGRNGRSGG